MTRGRRIIAIGGDDQGVDAADTPIDLAPQILSEEAASAPPPWIDDDYIDEPRPPRRAEWFAPALALTAVAGWTGFFGWALRGYLSRPAAPVIWAGWIGDWAVPVLLIAVVWLIVQRTSRREANRFGDVAAVLNRESALLETRLTTINQELSLAREFVAAQSRDLEALGRVAVDRLSHNADRLQTLIHDNGAQLDAIGSVSTTALDNMERLRGQLPVIASSAKDVTNNIGNAGRTAHAQLQEMITGFKRLTDFGQASERHVVALRGQMAETMDELERQADQLDSITESRMGALKDRGTQFRTQLDSHEIEALASVRTRAAALSSELEHSRERLDSDEAATLTSLRARLTAIRAESGTIARSLSEAEDLAVGRWQAQLTQMDSDMRSAIAAIEQVDGAAIASARERLIALVDEAQVLDANLAERDGAFAAEMEERHHAAAQRQDAAAAALVSQLAKLDADIERRAVTQRQRTADLAGHAEAIHQRLTELERQMTHVATQGHEAELRLAAGLTALTEALATSRQTLVGTDREIAGITDSTVRLLELIQAGIRHSRDDLPTALGAGEARLAAMEDRIFMLRDTVQETSASGESLSNYVLATRSGLAATRADLDQLYDRAAERGAEQGAVLAEIHDRLDLIGTDTRALAVTARGELSHAIDELSQAARDAVAGIEHHGVGAVQRVADRLGEDSGAAIERAMRSSVAEISGQLEQAASHAAGVGREAAIQLRDQLGKVDELAGNLERRVIQARERAEEQVDGDFARRIALITDSLNSNAIDIAKALSVEVSDTAWAAYLRGDRGIFTRRAVTLIDTGEARIISQLYENDRDFSEHVSRYIHDFEGMLRQLLSTRDGHVLGVTLLSSDMGKLYVALAQAIERLRN